MEKEINIKKISPEKVQQKFTEGDDFVLIDVLTGYHFAMVHIPEAVNICVFEVMFIENVTQMFPDKNKVIILYGASSKTMDALTAAEKLIREGYSNVLIMEGGLKGWVESGMKVAGEDINFQEKIDKESTWNNGSYTIDLEKSMIGWIGRNPNTVHHGTIGLSSGEIIVKDDRVSGTFDIDMKTIKNINLEGDALQPVLESHLMSDDFFFVKIFPKATFTITSAKQINKAVSSEPNFEVHGDLKLRGVKKSIHFPANVSKESDGEIKIEAHFDIDRTRWNVIYGSTRYFEHLGMHLVFDFISIQLCLFTCRAG